MHFVSAFLFGMRDEVSQSIFCVMLAMILRGGAVEPEASFLNILKAIITFSFGISVTRSLGNRCQTKINILDISDLQIKSYQLELAVSNKLIWNKLFQNHLFLN